MGDGRGFSIKIDEASYQAVINGLRAITWKSEESIFSSAINRTAKKAQDWWQTAVSHTYVGEWPRGLKERSTIRKSTTANVGAEIIFKSEIPGIRKFQASPGATPTVFSRSAPRRWRKLAVGPNEDYMFFLLGPQKRYRVTGRQRKDQGPTVFTSSFMVTFGASHEAVAWRKDGSDRKEHRIRGDGKHGRFPQRYPLGQAFGSSDRAMADNETVHAEVDPKVEKFLNDEVAKALERALASASAK